MIHFHRQILSIFPRQMRPSKHELQSNTKAGAIVFLVRQYGQRRAMEAFKGYFEAYNRGRSAADCKAEFDKIRAAVPGVTGATSKDAMRDALRAYEEALPAGCIRIPSEDQFYGFSKGAI